MVSHQCVFSPDCATHPRDVAESHQDKGLQGCKTYVSDPGESKKAILYIYDVGGFCPQTYQGESSQSNRAGRHPSAQELVSRSTRPGRVADT